MSDNALVRELAALRVGPDDVLVLRLPPSRDETDRQETLAALVGVGLAHRSLVIAGDIDMLVVEKDTHAANLDPGA